MLVGLLDTVHEKLKNRWLCLLLQVRRGKGQQIKMIAEEMMTMPEGMITTLIEGENLMNSGADEKIAHPMTTASPRRKVNRGNEVLHHLSLDHDLYPLLDRNHIPFLLRPILHRPLQRRNTKDKIVAVVGDLDTEKRSVVATEGGVISDIGLGRFLLMRGERAGGIKKTVEGDRIISVVLLL